MYTKPSRITLNYTSLTNYILESDVYNSKLLYLLSDPNISRVDYTITVSEYRPDLIAKDFYGSVDYLPYVILSAGLGLEQYRKGAVISLVPKDILDSFIKGL